MTDSHNYIMADMTDKQQQYQNLIGMVIEMVVLLDRVLDMVMLMA
jgi:hypothetical protein